MKHLVVLLVLFFGNILILNSQIVSNTKLFSVVDEYNNINKTLFYLTRIRLDMERDKIKIEKSNSGRDLKINLVLNTDKIENWHEQKGNFLIGLKNYIDSLNTIFNSKKVEISVDAEFSFSEEIQQPQFDNFSKIPLLVYYDESYNENIQSYKDYRIAYPNIQFYRSDEGKVFYWIYYPIFQSFYNKNVQFNKIYISKTLFFNKKEKQNLKLDLTITYIDLFSDLLNEIELINKLQRHF